MEPLPVDAWYLHAVGLTFVRRLARERVGDDLRIALIMQKVDPVTQQRRYISVNSDSILRMALKETFDEPDQVLVLHIISLEKVIGQKSIHVTPEINPNVSPEPVPPLGLVFPTLAVEAVQEVPEAMALSASYRLSQSAYNFDKLGHSSFVATADKLPAHEEPSMIRSQVFGFTGKSASVTATVPADSTDGEENTAEDDAPFAFSAVGGKLIADQDHIPMARVVDHEGDVDAVRIPSDYVMLDLQNGAGLGEPPAMPATSASTFFISPTWHLQAEEMSASARVDADMQRETSSASRHTWSATNNSSSMEESFVMLDRDLSPK